MIKNIFLIFCCALIVILNQNFHGTKGEPCLKKNYTSNIRIQNLSSSIDFVLPDRQNLSTYFMTITYTWNVHGPEGDDFDGFIYCFTDVEKEYNSNFKGFISPSMDFPPLDRSPLFSSSIINDEYSAFSNCEFYNGQYWMTTYNGTYINCTYPCSEVINASCYYFTPPACTHLSRNCFPLPKYARNLTFFIEFGRRYRFLLIPYQDHFTYDMHEAALYDFSLFCVQTFIEKYNLNEEIVRSFCEENQTIASQQSPSGPPARFHVKEILYDLIKKTVTVQISWRSPYDIAPNATINTFYLIANETYEGSTLVDAKSPEELEKNSFYTNNLTFDNIAKNQDIQITLMTTVKLGNCDLLCLTQGEQIHLILNIPAYSPCNVSINQPSFCDPVALCKPLSGKRQLLANCSCPPGYIGNGINLNLTIGTGCHDFNACTDSSKSFCSSNALCEDAPPPRMDALRCTCRENYVGDGRNNAIGCVHKGVIIALSIMAIFVGIGAVALAKKFRNRLKSPGYSKHRQQDSLPEKVVYTTS